MNQNATFVTLLCLVFGALSLGCTDEKGPVFISVTELTDSTSTIGPYEVVATLVDDHPIERVELRWAIGGSEDKHTIEMTSLGGHAWSAHIEGQPPGTTIFYQVAARDEDGNEVAWPAPFVNEAGDTELPVHSFSILDPVLP